MHDLNDLRFFAEVIAAGGFSAAARRLGLPRSRLSRRIGLLEQRLGVRLVQRSTRHFTPTEPGMEFYRHCRAMLVEAEAAEEAMALMRTEPRGTVRVSCPASVIYFQLGAMVARFMARCPLVMVVLESTNRPVDVIREGFDLAIRVRFPPRDDSDLVVRKLAGSPQVLAASPALLARFPAADTPEGLAALPSLGWNPAGHDHRWRLSGPGGASAVVRHQPRFLCEDMVALREAALAGAGVGQFPRFVVAADLAAGRLVEALPGWAPPTGNIEAAFPSRRGVLPSVRALLDHLAGEYAAPAIIGPES